jgi:hypothetical protein
MGDDSGESLDSVIKKIKSLNSTDASDDSPQPSLHDLVPDAVTESTTTTDSEPPDSLRSDSVSECRDSEISFFLLKISEHCGREIESLSQAALEFKNLKYGAVLSGDLTISSFLKEFDRHFHVQAGTLDEVLDLIEVIQETALTPRPTPNLQIEMCERQNQELTARNQALSLNVAKLEKRIVDTEAASDEVKLRNADREDRTEKLIHQWKRLKGQVKVDRSEIDSLAKAKTAIQKA